MLNLGLPAEYPDSRGPCRMTMRTLNLDLGMRSYPIHIGRGLLDAVEVGQVREGRDPGTQARRVL